MSSFPPFPVLLVQVALWEADLIQCVRHADFPMKLDHPGGMTPFMMPRGTPDIPKSHPQRRAVWNSWVRDPSLTSSATFHEATGETGDVYILHPFMLHSASRNLLRTLRIITNPPVSLKEPFNYNRADLSLIHI